MPATANQLSRITHVNNLMDDIHNSSNQVYEHLAEREHQQAKTEIKKLISNLEGILNSLEDEI